MKRKTLFEIKIFLCCLFVYMVSEMHAATTHQPEYSTAGFFQLENTGEPFTA